MNEQPADIARSLTEPSSYLFVPANRPDRFGKAAASGAHRIILDLEDAVSPAEKDMARAAVIGWFRDGNAGIVRINGADSHWFDADLKAVAACPHAEIMVPKAEPSVLTDVEHYLVDRTIIALVETVTGLAQIREVAAVKGVARLAFGNIDFGTDARLPPRSAGLDHARFEIVIASRLAGLPPPVDGVTVELNDEEILQEDIRTARNLGFNAKLCVHPRQTGPVNTGFAPADDEIKWAVKVMDAISKSGNSVTQIDGKMIDKPVVDRARFLLARR